MNSKPLYGPDDILSVLPHRPPFLFVDCVVAVEPHRRIEARRLLRPEEPQFAGHFPSQAIMPGVLVAEALAQASGLLLGLSDKMEGAPPPPVPVLYHLAATGFKFIHPAIPGDELTLHSERDSGLEGVFRFNTEARVGDKIVARGWVMLARINA